MSLKNWFRSFPDNTRLTITVAWHGRARAAAVFTGVFLASLVITTVMAYSAGLMQIFFEEGLKEEEYDYRIEFWTGAGGNNRTANVSMYESMCDTVREMDGVLDCMVAAGRQGTRGGGFFNEDTALAQPLELTAIEGPDTNWSSIDITFPESEENGPPTRGLRPIRLIGPEGYDGELLKRHSRRMISGDWPQSGEEAITNRSIIIPAKLASAGSVEVGQTFSKLNFTYDSKDDEPCESGIGEIVELEVWEGVTEYCRVTVTLENLSVGGIYDDRTYSSPLISNQPIYVPWQLVSESELSEIIAGDHTYLAVAMDRGALPTNSIDDVEDQLNEWKVELDGLDYGEDIRMRAYDMDAGLLDFLNIFLIFIQIFDYIVMIPIVVLSISVLVYGLLLSLEQRRKEIAIHRVIGGSAKGLQRMVMGELFVIATIAWLMGYLLAIATVPLVLSSVGFMAFRFDDVRTPPTLSMMTTLGTAVFTIGLALLFGRGRTKQFLATEINEGVQELPKERAPRYWLHWLTFALGLIALIDSIMEDQNVGDGEGIVSNFFYDALLAIFGPFLLWIGGALVLSRIGAKGPVLMQFVLGRTKLLKDVRRGLTGSGSAEGVGRLAFIILLTLSIVTMAAVQGYTGTVVDEQTADLQTGGDLNVQFRFPIDEANASAVVSDAWDSTDSDRSASFTAFTVPTFLTSPENDEKNLLQVWVITNRAADHLLWNDQALPGTVKQTLVDLREVGTVTHGEDAGWDLDLRDGGDMVTLNWSDGGGTPIQMEVTTLGEHSWIPGLPTTDAMNVLFVGEATWRSWLGDAAPSAENLTSQRWLFDVGAMAEDEDGLHLRQLAVQLSTDSSVGSADDWSSQHRDVERNGGLVFGTPGLLSLQFVVSALAAIASSFVFLSLVLDRRKKELAILQAIGASPNQVTRLVLFEILSITIVSMLLGGLLGIGIAYAFNDLFNLFGIIFQAFGGEGTAIERTLVWPIGELLKIGGIVLAAVLAALLLTMRKSLTSDLAVVLKGE